jgi:hypothetical protein
MLGTREQLLQIVRTGQVPDDDSIRFKDARVDPSLEIQTLTELAETHRARAEEDIAIGFEILAETIGTILRGEEVQIHQSPHKEFSQEAWASHLARELYQGNPNSVFATKLHQGYVLAVATLPDKCRGFSSNVSCYREFF